MYFCRFCEDQFEEFCVDENCPKCGKRNPSHVSRRKLKALAVIKTKKQIQKIEQKAYAGLITK
jgi:hypothetical protein